MIINGSDLAIASLFVTALVTVLWWGLRQLVHSQLELGKKIGDLSVSVAKICGNIETSIQWQESHEEKDLMRHQQHANEAGLMRVAVERIRDRELEDSRGEQIYGRADRAERAERAER